MADWGLDDLSEKDERAQEKRTGSASKGAASFGVDDWSERGPAQADTPTPEVDELRANLVLSPLDETAVGAFMNRAADMMGGAGFTDEVGAAGVAGIDWLLGQIGVRDPMPFGERYDEIRAAQEGKNAYLREEHPVASVAGDITGLVAGPVGQAGNALFRGAARLPGGLLPRAVGYGTAGAAEGGLLGFSTGEGGVGERIDNAARGAITGGVAGAGLGTALDVAGRALASRVPKQYRPNQAAANVERTLRDEGMSAPRVAARMREIGDDAIPADTTPGLRRLLEDAANRNRIVYAQAENALTPRQEALGERVIGATRTATGAEGKALVSAKAIADQKRSIAQSMLPQAKSAGFEITDDIADLLKRPTIRGAYDDAVAIAADQGVTLPPIESLAKRVTMEAGDEADTAALEWARRVLGDQADDIPAADPESVFDAFDYIRKALNQRAALNTGITSADIGSDAMARVVNAGKLARDWRDALKAQNPTYADYLSQYADEFANESALKLGQAIWRTQAKGGVIDQLDDTLKGMSDAERGYFREGLVQSIRDSIETGAMTGDSARRVYRSKRMQDILKKSITSGLDEKTAQTVWRDFDRAMKGAIEQAKTFSQVLGGPQTARRMQGGAGLGESAMTAGEQALVGDRVGALRTLARSLTGAGKPSSADDIALGKLLMDPNFSVGQIYAQRIMGPEGRGLLSPAFTPGVEVGRQTNAYGLLPAPQSPR